MLASADKKSKKRKQNKMSEVYKKKKWYQKTKEVLKKITAETHFYASSLKAIWPVLKSF